MVRDEPDIETLRHTTGGDASLHAWALAHRRRIEVEGGRCRGPLWSGRHLRDVTMMPGISDPLVNPATPSECGDRREVVELLDKARRLDQD